MRILNLFFLLAKANQRRSTVKEVADGKKENRNHEKRIYKDRKTERINQEWQGSFQVD